MTFFLHILRFIRTQNLLFANSLPTLCSYSAPSHLTLEMCGSYIAYGGRVPFILASMGERGRGGAPEMRVYSKETSLNDTCTMYIPISNKYNLPRAIEIQHHHTHHRRKTNMHIDLHE